MWTYFAMIPLREGQEMEIMTDESAGFDAAYLQAKRQQLLKLRTELQQVANSAETEEVYVRTTSPREAQEYEDSAEALDMLERQGLLVNRSVQRIARIDRALAKIADGTYGYSEEGGERIPYERLDSMPDAINTLHEQEIAEREAR